MTTVAVLAEPPEPGHVLPEIVAGTPLSETEAARLYEAMLVDLCRTVQAGGADLLVNYRQADATPVSDPEAALREVLAGELDAPDAPRYEVQVGESFSGRVGNTVTHLLEEEGEVQVVATTPKSPFLRRDLVGAFGMSLRTDEVAIAPAPGGRVAAAGFTEPVDFAAAYATPATQTLTERARDADLGVDFLEMLPAVETPRGLAEAVATLRARTAAGRVVPAATAETVEELNLGVTRGDAGLAVTR